MRKLAGVLFMLVAALLPVHAAVIFSETFDGVPGGTYGAGSVIGQFTVESGSIDITGASTPWTDLCPSPGSGRCVDLDGNESGSIRTTNLLDFSPGAVYWVNYTILGSQRGAGTTTQISVGSLAGETVFRSSSDVSGPAGSTSPSRLRLPRI